MIALNSVIRRFFAIFALPTLLLSCSSGNNSLKMTDALDGAAWDSSCWISAADAPVITEIVGDNEKYRSADGASWFAANPVNAKKLVSAKWMASGLGVFELYVNGLPVGEEFLKPGFTHYQKTKYSFTYDVTSMMDCSKGALNQLSAQVTPGWWADKILTPGGHRGMVGDKPAFRSVLELTYNDGSKELFGTDTLNWKAGVAGPVKHAAIFDGEAFDAREPMGYDCAGKLSTPEVNTAFSGEVLPSPGAEVYLRRDLTLKPVRAYIWKEVESATDSTFGKIIIDREYKDGQTILLHPGENLVVDFGQNCSAVPCFVFNAGEGTVLTCLPSEILNDGNGAKSRGMDGPEGSCHRRNLRTPDYAMRLDYTFAASDKPVAYYPHFTFFGYRYISVSATSDVSIESVVSIPVTSITKEMETGSIVTGNELINKLISNTIWGMRSNYLSIPTDCPQRNERLGWTADTQVFSETGAFFANTSSFFHKWMRDMRDTQSETGAYPGVAPHAQYGSDNCMRLGWSDAGIIVPWTIWRQFGDTALVEECWESMNRYMTHVYESKYDHETLKNENHNYQWADWLSYEPLESCSTKAYFDDKSKGWFLRPETLVLWNYLSASYWAIDASMMRDMAEATGRDASVYALMADEAKAYMREKFLNDDGTFKTDILNTMQTPALFALKNGLVEGQAKEAVIKRLRENFEAHGNCLQTGFLGTSILMKTLTDNGMVDIAQKLLLQRRNPSWLYSVDNGATTIWERWNSYTIESGMGPSGMNSFNHYAYGCVCAWIWNSLAGIEADVKAPGFKNIIMAPHPFKELKSLDASYKSSFGEIKSAWHYEGDVCKWTFTIPEGATATVTVPGSEPEHYESGTYNVEF